MNDIVDTLINDGRFTTLVEAVNRASLAQGLMEAGTVTIFAPTDEAFSKLPSGMMGFLLDNPPELEQLLSYHVIAQRITSNDLSTVSSAPTVEGSLLTVEGTKVNDATIVQADIEASNGVIHAIDSVLIPESVSNLSMAG
jgi:uncharacterized surface protein with fasciclin (FAS1) repeats